MANSSFIDFMCNYYSQHTCVSDEDNSFVLYPANQMDTVFEANRQADSSWKIDCFEADTNSMHVETWRFNKDDCIWEQYTE